MLGLLLVGGGGGGVGGDYSVSSCAQSAAAVCQQHPEPCEPLHGCREMINGAETCRLGGAFGLIKCFFLLFVFFFPPAVLNSLSPLKWFYLLITRQVGSA